MKRFLAVALILLTACTPTKSDGPNNGEVVDCSKIKVSTSVTGIKLPCLNGNSGYAIEQLRGPVIVNVWGSWCPPCREEIPYFVKLNATKKIPIVGIAVEEAKIQDPQSYVRLSGITYPNLFDDKNSTRSIFGMGVPLTVYIDETGQITKKKIGRFANYKELLIFASSAS